MGNNSFIAPSTPLDRRHLGKYEVLCRLSTGGMSAIYLAHQTGLAGFKKLVVLKTILPDIGGEEDFVGMFLEEARITAVFNHPNIAQVFELETDEGQLFMAMEFIQGCTLVEMARACRQAKEAIPVGFTLAATRDTALALHYAHTFTDARGRRQIVIHRDVAEKNIMVTYEGVTKLLDFGIAKALGRSGRTSIGMVKGTSGYMSPEQIRGEPLDPRSDIFALGVVMHECLTGLRLFHGKTAEEGMMAALREEVQPPSKWNKEVGPDLDAVVLKALQRDREKRFNTALEFARAIEKAAPGLLWHPEQLGEVVTRHFADRRSETRRLLESAEFGSETTGEVKVQNVLAKVRAGALTASSGQAAEPRPGDTPRKASLVTAPRVVMPREENEMTRPGVMPGDLKHPPPAAPSEGTSPARPRALRGPSPSAPPGAGQNSSPSGVTSPSPALARPPFKYEDDDDDDAGDKTIPAAALPDEIKNLRAQFAAARKNTAEKMASEPPPTASEATTTSRERVLADRASAPSQELTPAANNVVVAGGSPVPQRTVTGETISITNKGNPMDWEEEDDDEGAKTAIAKPGELPGLAALRAGRRPVPSPTPFRPEPMDEPQASAPSLPEVGSFDDEEDFEMVRPKRTGLILALLVLAALAVGGLLVLLDVVPLPKLPGGGRKVGQTVHPERSRGATAAGPSTPLGTNGSA
ncbi:MAG: protein kinase [Archangium sp.]|nr:protein kinase [Archangium sp.]